MCLAIISYFWVKRMKYCNSREISKLFINSKPYAVEKVEPSNFDEKWINPRSRYSFWAALLELVLLVPCLSFPVAKINCCLWWSFMNFKTETIGNEHYICCISSICWLRCDEATSIYCMQGFLSAFLFLQFQGTCNESVFCRNPGWVFEKSVVFN